LQLNYDDHAFLIKPEVVGIPGTYLTDLYFTCPQCGFNDNIGEVDPAEIGTATVTSLGDGDHDGDDPVSTPEPGALLLLGAGIAAMALTITLQKFRA
jgi:hypothetical protein